MSKKDPKTLYTLTYFSTPSELVKVYQKYLDAHLWKVAHLVDRFGIFFEAGEDEFVSAIHVSSEYRKADIYFSSKFLELDETSRHEAISHELAHVLIDPLYKGILEIVDCYVEAGAHPYIMEQIRKQHEIVTENFSRCLVDYKKDSK
jgi:hypothetical protein